MFSQAVQFTSKKNKHIPAAGLAKMPNEKTVTLEKLQLNKI